MRAAESEKFNIVDLFSGAGGMSYGFKAHGAYRMLAAADAEIGKPTSGDGRLQCNQTYAANIGIEPKAVDLARVAPSKLRDTLCLGKKDHVDVLSVCPPCTGFSRAVPNNHLFDDARNGFVRKAADFALGLEADVIVMENARELIRGNFSHHYDAFRKRLEEEGYNVFGRNYFLDRFGLPQRRERSIIVAAKDHLPLYTLESMWDGWGVVENAKTVRRALKKLNTAKRKTRRYPKFASSVVRERMQAIPKDGGSWTDLICDPAKQHHLTGSMRRIVEAGRIGSYPDVYGRMAWDKPAPTIKRECAHVGNGRYAHPEEDRLCSVEEMGLLQGFPVEFNFCGSSLSNSYRHIGDAVPPLISYQLAHLCHWMLTNKQPGMQEIVLPGTSLSSADLIRISPDEI